MKKIVICTFLIAAGTVALLNINDKMETKAPEFALKNSYALALGYDKSMSEKAVKAAVIDSYFRKVAANGKIIRWNKSTFPLKVYVQDSADVPEYYREVVMSAYQAWQRASEGLVSFDFVEDANDADMKCYFKNTDNKKSIGAQLRFKTIVLISSSRNWTFSWFNRCKPEYLRCYVPYRYKI